MKTPPPNTRCDASTGWGDDPYGKPVVHRCKNPATESSYMKDVLAGWFAEVEIWLCESCANIMRERGDIK